MVPARAGSARDSDSEVPMSKLPDPLAHRRADHPIEPWILQRWSPRAMAAERVDPGELARLFEAARWAPSTYNEQEWRFRYAHRDTPHWQRFLDLLVEQNRVWCKDAGVLVAIFARTTLTRTGKPNPVHLFDCGCAFENLALQGAAMGLVVHGMAGFDWARIGEALQAPPEFVPAAMFAIGRPGDPARLPDALRQKEVPSQRRPLAETAGEGPFAR
jgi:nitroreductase